MLEACLNEVTIGLIEDMKSLREGKITNSDARVRAQLAREILRGVHLHLEGIKMIQVSPENRKIVEAETT